MTPPRALTIRDHSGTSGGDGDAGGRVYHPHARLLPGGLQGWRGAHTPSQTAPPAGRHQLCVGGAAARHSSTDSLTCLPTRRWSTATPVNCTAMVVNAVPGVKLTCEQFGYPFNVNSDRWRRCGGVPMEPGLCLLPVAGTFAPATPGILVRERVCPSRPPSG